MNVALVHYWLTGVRGGEKVLAALADLYPDADVFTHTSIPAVQRAVLGTRTVRTTFIHRLPRATTWYQYYLPLMPFALEALDLSAYDLVISSESGPAKGIITRADSLHLCYCHSPMRYLWDQHAEYRAASGFVSRLFLSVLGTPLRAWDVSTAARVDRFVANSTFVAQRIRKFYRREAVVIPPPVDTDVFRPGSHTADNYLFVGQLVPYKRAEVAIAACNALGRPLVIAGHGPELDRLRRLASPTVRFAGRVSDEELATLYAESRALLFPGVEDFGIVPLEAMASGRPVIALGRGGALDTVVDGVTGVLYDDPGPDGLASAIRRFEQSETRFAPAALRHHAERYSPGNFRTRFKALADREVLRNARRSTATPARRPAARV